MSTSQRRGAPAGAVFRPTAMLIAAYLSAFFLVFALLLVLPALLPLLQSTVPGPELQALAKETARSTISPRLGLAFGLAVVATTLGAWLRVLPGLPKA